MITQDIASRCAKGSIFGIGASILLANQQRWVNPDQPRTPSSFVPVDWSKPMVSGQVFDLQQDFMWLGYHYDKPHAWASLLGYYLVIEKDPANTFACPYVVFDGYQSVGVNPIFQFMDCKLGFTDMLKACIAYEGFYTNTDNFVLVGKPLTDSSWFNVDEIDATINHAKSLR